VDLSLLGNTLIIIVEDRFNKMDYQIVLEYILIKNMNYAVCLKNPVPEIQQRNCTYINKYHCA